MSYVPFLIILLFYSCMTLYHLALLQKIIV
nr:MAG TPA: hypothetical protein [Caudoviricetes sp.]